MYNFQPYSLQQPQYNMRANLFKPRQFDTSPLEQATPAQLDTSMPSAPPLSVMKRGQGEGAPSPNPNGASQDNYNNFGMGFGGQGAGGSQPAGTSAPSGGGGKSDAAMKAARTAMLFFGL